MFCPKCATQNVEGASFCRTCGANISLVPQALTGQLVPPQNTDVDVWSRHGRRRRPPSVDEAVRSLFMGIAFAIITVLVSKFSPGGGTWAFWLLIPSMALFAKGFSELIRLKLSKSQAPHFAQPQMNTVRPSELPISNTNELRPPVPSVTEGTTRHLGQEAVTKHFDSWENQKPS